MASAGMIYPRQHLTPGIWEQRKLSFVGLFGALGGSGQESDSASVHSFKGQGEASGLGLFLLQKKLPNFIKTNLL